MRPIVATVQQARLRSKSAFIQRHIMQLPAPIHPARRLSRHTLFAHGDGNGKLGSIRR